MKSLLDITALVQGIRFDSDDVLHQFKDSHVYEVHRRLGINGFDDYAHTKEPLTRLHDVIASHVQEAINAVRDNKPNFFKEAISCLKQITWYNLISETYFDSAINPIICEIKKKISCCEENENECGEILDAIDELYEAIHYYEYDMSTILQQNTRRFHNLIELAEQEAIKFFAQQEFKDVILSNRMAFGNIDVQGILDDILNTACQTTEGKRGE